MINRMGGNNRVDVMSGMSIHCVAEDGMLTASLIYNHFVTQALGQH